MLGLPPQIDANLIALLPDGDPSVQALRKLHDEEGGVNLLTMAFDADDEADLSRFLDDLVVDLEALESVEFALHRLDEDLVFQLGILQLEEDEVRELSARMQGALALGPAMNPFVAQRLMAMGPLTERISAAGSTTELAGPGAGRLVVRPTGSSHDIPFARALMADIDRTLENSLARAEGIELRWLGGGYRHNVEDFEGVQEDALWTAGTSLVLVLSVVIIAFRSWRGVVLVFVPLLLANLVNLSLIRVFVGPLNTYTSFGTAILLGLGVDFAVHLVGRYREMRAGGLDVERAVITAWDRTGPPCMTAALTSAAGFLALAAASFKGFAQLGLMLSMGLMVCLASMLCLLPILITLLDREAPVLVGTDAGPRKKSRSTYAAAPLGLMIMVLATGTVGAMTLPNLEWEYDHSALRRSGLSYDDLSEEERALARESYAPVVVSYPNEKRMLRDHDRLEKKIELGDLPHVSKVVSIRTALPADLEERVAALQEVRGLLDHKNLRFLPPPLVEGLLPLKEHPPRVISTEDLPDPVLRLIGANDGHHRLLVLPTGNMWDMREAAALSDEIRAGVRSNEVAGEYITLGSLLHVVMHDMPIVALLAFVMVTLLTAIDLRRLHLVAAAMGTLLAGMTWAGAAVYGFEVKLSILNIVGLPILLGIGVDIVIHLLHRLEEEGPGGVRRALRTTGVAASISAVTTILSFSSLTLAGNRGVRSMGLLVVIGLVAVSIACGVVLTTAWSAAWKVTGRAPADSEEG